MGRRVRRVTWQDFNGHTEWVEGDVNGWVDEGSALAFVGRKKTIRIQKSNIVRDVEYNSSSCFISTAVYTNLGFNDDCVELKTLRDYRDNYLLKTANGRDMVDEYYSIAPTIVNKIEQSENKYEIYFDIYNRHLKNILHLIQNEEFESAAKKYKEMVKELKLPIG